MYVVALFPIILFVTCVTSYDLIAIITSLNKLYWHEVTIVTNDPHSFPSMAKSLREMDINWKIKTNCDQLNIRERILVFHQDDLDKCKIMEKPAFSIVLVNHTEVINNDNLPSSIGFYLWKNQSILECFNLKDLFCFSDNEKYDFQGNPLTTLYSEAAQGDHHFYMHVLDKLTSQYNFTMDFHLSHLSSWGARPKDKCNWTAVECFDNTVFGEFVTDKFDFMGNMWFIVPQRQALTSYLQPLGADYFTLYVNTSLIPQGWDWTFYFKPLDYQSWIGLSITYFLIVLAYMAAWKCLKRETQSMQLLSWIGWLLFNILLAYYSGVQTMFLSVPKELSMTSSVDVLESPDYELIYVKGYDIVLDIYAREGLPLFVQYKEDMKAKNYNGHDTINDAIQTMGTEPGKVLVYVKAMMVFFINDTYSGKKAFYTAGKEFEFLHGILTPKNPWPLRRLLNRGMTQLYDTGILAQALNTYMELKIEAKGPDESANPINFLTSIGAFIIMGIGVIFCFILFVIEIRFNLAILCQLCY